jgi:hypothetical protein
MSLFKPDYYIQNYEHLDPKKLTDKGIKLLCCDIDNTLVAYNDPDSNEKVKRFIARMKEAGLEVALLSNAAPKRAKRFSADLGVEKVYYLSLKPLQHNFRSVMKHYGVTPKQTALLGDQLFTDMLGAHIAGVYSILTAPLVQEDKWDTRINRFFEGFIYRYFDKHDIFHKGDFDD